MFSLCSERCVNQVICGCITFIPSIWMWAVELKVTVEHTFNIYNARQ